MHDFPARWSRARFRLALLVFVAFLGLVIYTADIGKGPRYWGWLARVPLGDKFCHAGFMLTLTALSNLAPQHGNGVSRSREFAYTSQTSL